MENETITPIVEEPVIKETTVSQVSLKPKKKNNLFKIVAVVIGILVVVGLFVNAYLMFSKKETITKTPDSSVVATPTLDPTAEWVTFTNPDWNYEIKAPSDWKETEHSSNFNYTTSLQAQDQSNLIVTIKNEDTNTLEKILQNQDQIDKTSWEGKPSKEIVSSKQILVGNYSGIEREEKWLAAGFTAKTTYILVNGKFVSFAAYPENSTAIELYDQILSTFKFTESSISSIQSDWKTYTNGEAGYSLRYPSTWSFQGTSEGCGPVFYPPNTKKIWLTICGLYINPTDTPEEMANRLTDATTEVISKEPIIIDNHTGIRQELKRNTQQEIAVFMGNVKGITTSAKGTLGIYYYIQDLSNLSGAKNDFDQILSTFKFTP